MRTRPRHSISPWSIRAVYQPIVDLKTNLLVGAEALIRDTTGRSGVLELFDDARRAGTCADLDWQCRIHAMEGWLAARVPPSQALFFNVEPEALSTPAPPGFEDLLARVEAAGVRVVVEITERQLTRDPRGLFRFRDELHRRGWALAVDDIGADPASLAMLPLLEPDVIKLDMQLMHRAPSLETAQVFNAVNAQASRTGALVLAEGIETEQQREFAVSAGARLGQGWLFGHPSAALPEGADLATEPVVVPGLLRHDVVGPVAGTPWHLVKGRADLLRGGKPLLTAISRHLELQATSGDPSTVLIGALQHRRYLSPATLERYASLAADATFFGVLGAEIDRDPAPGVRGGALDPRHPLAQEWTVVVITPFFAAALIAHDTQLAAPSDDDRQFDYLVTYDRSLVLAAGRLMMQAFDGGPEA